MVYINKDDADWRELALCKGMPVENFFEWYENSTEFAKVIDQNCLSCPVLQQCLSYATETKQSGVWGGVYLTAGKPDKDKNIHKTKSIWNQIEGRINE